MIMRKTAIRPKKLSQLARQFLREHSLPERSTDAAGGRPKSYPDDLILTLAAVQRLGPYSFRQALAYCADFFPDLPSLSAYYERLQALPKKLIKDFIAHLGT